MDMKDLEIFKSIVNHKNVTKAAIELNYVQSNVTSRLAKLEKEIGATLLIRTNKGVRLTAEGNQFLTYADKMLQLYKEVVDSFSNPSTPSGSLTIGATDITTAARLPTVLTTFLESFPLVEFSLINGSSENLVKEVLQYNLDGEFITDTIDEPKIAQESLIHEELVLISNKGHPPINTLKDLKKNTILVFNPGCTYRRKMEAWVKEEGVVVRKVEFGTIEGMIGCVKAGLGVALVSKLIAQQLNSGKKLMFHPVPGEYRFVKTVFIRRKDIPVSNALQKFIEASKQSFLNAF